MMPVNEKRRGEEVSARHPLKKWWEKGDRRMKGASVSTAQGRVY